MQRYTNFECLVVLDGFSSEAQRVFDEVVVDDPRFLLIRHTHAGLAHTRTQGIHHTQAEWIISLDSDDYFVDETALETIHTTIQQAGTCCKPYIIGGLKTIDLLEIPDKHTLESWLVYAQYSISMCAIPRALLDVSSWNTRDVYDFDVRAVLTPLIMHQANIVMLSEPVVSYRRRIGSLNHIKETQMPELEIKQAIGTYQKLLKLDPLSFRQKILCWLAITRYSITPPTHICDRIWRGCLTKISKILSGSGWILQ